MRTFKTTVMLSCLLLATSACSTRPRYFTATVNPPPSDAAKFEQDVALCRALVGKGHKSEFLAQAASVGAGTLAASAVTTAAVISTTGFLEATAASTALGAVALPFGVLAGFGITRVIRSKRERTLKASLTTCLSEFNYTVVAWTPTKPPKFSAQQTSIAPPVAAPEPQAPK